MLLTEDAEFINDNDDMIVVNKYYKSINGETVTVVLNSNMDFHHEMRFKYSKEIYPIPNTHYKDNMGVPHIWG